MSHDTRPADADHADHADRQRSESPESTGADAVPDKTTGTAAGGASFPDEETGRDDNADTTVNDQDG